MLRLRACQADTGRLPGIGLLLQGRDPSPTTGRSQLVHTSAAQVIKVGTSSLVRPEQNTLNLSSLARLCEVRLPALDLWSSMRAQPAENAPAEQAQPVLTQHAALASGRGCSCRMAPCAGHAVGSLCCMSTQGTCSKLRGPQTCTLQVVRDLHAEGHRVVIVSSGAVGVGAQRLGLAQRPKEIAQKQALAAVGQVHLMRYYEDFFHALGLVWRWPVWVARDLARHRHSRGAQCPESESA